MLEQGVRSQSNGYMDNRFYEEIISLSLCIELQAVVIYRAERLSLAVIGLRPSLPQGVGRWCQWHS